MKSIPIAFLFFICLTLWGEFGSSVALSCDSCGSECARACGTRHFRTCCFNYVRKRTIDYHPYPLNRFNYETLYGTSFDGGDIKRFENTHELKAANNENTDSDGSEIRKLKNFYKPWKESHPHMDNEVVFEYEQQEQRHQNQQGLEAKQQQQQQPQHYIYDA